MKSKNLASLIMDPRQSPVLPAKRILPSASCLLPAAFRRLPAVLGLLLSVFCLLPSAAQTPEPIETLRIDANLVNLNVSVFSKDVSQLTPALQQKEFAVFENGEPQEITFFASAETPFDLVLLLDLSGSTAKKIDLIRKSAKRFVDAARPDDRIAVMTFTDQVQAVSLLTADHKALKKNIDEMEKPFGGTNFWDSLRFVIEHVLGQSRSENRRSAIVVMTDGIDNALPDIPGEGSLTPFNDLVKIVGRSDSIVLPIYLDTEKEFGQHGKFAYQYALARQQLAELAAESGNFVYQARKVKDLEGVYAQVIRDLSTVYSLGYRPATQAAKGDWRGLNVQLIGHPELVVHSKRGYYAK